MDLVKVKSTGEYWTHNFLPTDQRLPLCIWPSGQGHTTLSSPDAIVLPFHFYHLQWSLFPYLKACTSSVLLHLVHVPDWQRLQECAEITARITTYELWIYNRHSNVTVELVKTIISAFPAYLDPSYYLVKILLSFSTREHNVQFSLELFPFYFLIQYVNQNLQNLVCTIRLYKYFER